MSALIKVRLFTYKSRRHYGGRDITPMPHICGAKFLFDQVHTKVVELQEDCAGFRRGHKIAVQNSDFDIK